MRRGWDRAILPSTPRWPCDSPGQTVRKTVISQTVGWFNLMAPTTQKRTAMRSRPSARRHASRERSPRLMRSLSAADRPRSFLRTAQPSILSIISCGSLAVSSGYLPVAGRPRPRFSGITFIDFRAICQLYLNRSAEKDPLIRMLITATNPQQCRSKLSPSDMARQLVRCHPTTWKNGLSY